MESNNQFLQESSPQLSQIAASESENSIDEELDELELEAIAGGYHIYTGFNGDWSDKLSLGAGRKIAGIKI